MKLIGATTAALSAVLLTTAAMAQPPQQFGGGGGPGQRGGGPGGPGGPGGRDIELVGKFDKDKNGRLNTAERKLALEYLKKQNEQGGGRRRGPGGRGPGMRGGNTGKPGPKVSVESVKPIAGEDLYDTSVLRTIFLQFENEEWEQELESFKPTDVEVPATMTVDGKTYPEVGVGFRGSSSFFMVPAGNKRSFNISIDYANDAQRLYGVKTLNLLNCNGDASLMSSMLYHDIASKKIATPRANFVKLVINGRSWGIYANVEQFNKDFLKHNYDSKKGARWKVSGNPNADNGLRYIAGDLEQYKSRYSLRSKEDPKAWKDLVELTRIIDQTPAQDLDKALEGILDVDGTLWFLAVDVATANSDGYWTRASDYSIYQNKEGKFHILPHDMNEAFGLAQHGGPGGPGGGGPRGFGPPGGFGGPPPGGFGGPPSGGFGGPPPGGFGGPPPGGEDGPPQGFGGPPQGGRGQGEGRQNNGQQQNGRRGFGARGGDQQRSGEQGQRGGRGRGFRGGRGGFRGGPGGGMGHGGPDLDPMVGVDNDRFPLRSKLLANENLKRRYLEHLRTIATDYLNWKYLGPKVAAARELVNKEVKLDTRKLMTYEAFIKATDNKNGTIKNFCTERAEYLLKYPAIKNLK